MSEQRWAVLGAAARNGWIVVHPGEVSRYDGRLHGWEVHSRHDTWAEAMQEADRMARTVTVTLPRNGKSVTFGPKTWMELRVDGGVTLHAEGPSIGIRKTHLEKAALTLLSHARGNTAGVPEAWCE